MTTGLDDRIEGGGQGDPWLDRLSDYLDDELTVEERGELEEHLSGCAACARTLRGLSQVVGRAEAMRQPAVPVGDLWPGIASRLAPRRPSRWRSRLQPAWWPALTPRLALAATVVLACIAALLWLRPAGTPLAPAPPALPPGSGSVVADADPGYYDAVASLRRELGTHLTADPQVLQVIEQNMEVLDIAIAQYQDALTERPDDERLRTRLAEARHRKLEVLRQAAGLAAEGTN